MLDGLDAIDWGALTHAYGPATEVPALLRGLLSETRRERERAQDTLFSTIFHQGTVYDSSAAAIPFLIELVASPDTPDRSDVALLLAAIADGTGYLEVHTRSDFGDSIWTGIFKKEGTTLEAELERERAVIARVREAAEAAVPHLLPFLAAEQPELRQQVAWALGRYPSRRDQSLPHLERALAREHRPDVRESLEDSIARLRAS